MDDIGSSMTPDQFTLAYARLGIRTQAEAAKVLGYSLRSVSGFANGSQPIPLVVELALRYLEQHPRLVKERL